jgi:VWFA-related protein
MFGVSPLRLIHYSLLLPLLWAVGAQDAKFSSDVKVVSLLATVHDSNGAIVKNLTKDDFRLQEDGDPQTIGYFARESDLPLTIGLLVDTSRSKDVAGAQGSAQRSDRVFESERVASVQFFNQVLREDRDLAAIVHFDIRVETLQGLTSSREKLAAALNRLQVQTRGSTLVYDAIHQASDDLMRKQTGRKAFILLSDGSDFGNHNTISSAIEYAQRADTMIYSMLFAHGRTRIGSVNANLQRGRQTMGRLALETGGEFFEVHSYTPIDQIYARIEEDLRNQYSIGYTPTRPDADGKYRRLRLTTTQRGLVVRTRDGYYPK